MCVWERVNRCLTIDIYVTFWLNIESHDLDVVHFTIDLIWSAFSISDDYSSTYMNFPGCHVDGILGCRVYYDLDTYDFAFHVLFLPLSGMIIFLKKLEYFRHALELGISPKQLGHFWTDHTIQVQQIPSFFREGCFLSYHYEVRIVDINL